MCGIAAAVGPETGELIPAVEGMCEQMVARGPDDGGVETIRASMTSAVLGSRRLSIIDPSPAGHQPMRDPERGTTIVFNGMIYNYLDLRARLAADGERFHSTCDTEVVLRAYGRYGVDCVRHLRGMFALAIWDERSQRLFLARDRLGIKPLYLWQQGDGTFLCASAVRALLASGLVEPRLSLAGVASFLATGAVSEPLTAIEGVRALPAGHRATLAGGALVCEPYLSPTDEALRIDRRTAKEQLRYLLEDGVRRHLVSDAPLGVFLSGGLDSSLLAALAAREDADVRTVTVDFEEQPFSERRHAAAVAERIGSRHIVLPLSSSQLRQWLDDAFRAMDQPSFDGINTYAVSRVAAETGVKVALSGLGADELFDGYGYIRRTRLLERARALPRPLRALSLWAAGVMLSGSSAEKTSAWLRGSGEEGSAYQLLRRLFAAEDVDRLLHGEMPVVASSNDEVASWSSVWPNGDLARQVTLLDIDNYLRNVLLRDTDGMGMGNSLEVRVPYLDDPIVTWALRVPAAVKGERKQLLKALAHEFLPKEIVSRSKHGFLLPFARWITDELRPDIEYRLREPPESLGAMVAPAAIASAWSAHLDGRSHWLRPWALYVLCRWTEAIQPRLGVTL